MKFEIEIDDKSEFVGDIPAELKTILERRETAAHGVGYGKGAEKTASEAKKQIEDAIKSEKLKLEAQMPVERAKWAEIEDSNKLLKSQLETIVNEHRKTTTAREEAHALEVTKRAESMAKRDSRIKELVNANLRALAAKAGARDESLSELEVILQHRIGYDDDMNPYVKAEDGSAAKTTAGNPIGIDVFVGQYLDNHPHHRKVQQGKSGDARPGASRFGAPTTTFDQAAARIDNGDRSPGAIHELFEAQRRKRA